MQSVLDAGFKKYGRVIADIDTSEIVKLMDSYDMPEDVVYVAGDKKLENTQIHKVMEESIYGGCPVQTGYCNGHNQKLNALEYHRSSEVNIAATDMILLLGSREDVKDDFTYETSKVEEFFVPEGTAIEVYATTLHYAPCGVDGNGFQVAVVLPKGTNYPLTSKHTRVHNNIAESEDALLAAANKWLIGHAEGGLDDTAFIGLKGVNLDINE